MAFRVRGLFSYWALPIISGIVWLTMLLVLLLFWIVHEHSVHYVSMAPRQKIAYISDVGADTLKPFFIAGCCVTTIFFDLSFAAERWLRHRGRLVPNGSRGEKILAGLTIVFATVGTAGLILLSIFDTVHHEKIHNVFLLLFIGGYMISAIFICWEYQRLGVRYIEHRMLRISFWIKLFFILTELCLAVAFATCSWKKKYDIAAILEWVVSLIFSFYVFSFIFDLWPAVHTRARDARFVKPGQPVREMEDATDNSERNLYRRDYQMDNRPNDF